jgi:hypothetical protein
MRTSGTRALAAIAAVAALGGGSVAAAPAATRPDQQGNCTRQRTDREGVRFSVRQCVRKGSDRVRADLRIDVRARVDTQQAHVRVRQRDRSELRNATDRLRVRVEQQHRVRDGVLRAEVRVRVELRAPRPDVQVDRQGAALVIRAFKTTDGQLVEVKRVELTVPEAATM